MRSLIETSALVVVFMTCAYFLTLGFAAVFAPRRASRFLLGFAATPFVHYTEMLMRLVVGGSLVVHAPQMFAARAVSLVGWAILITTAGLLLVPWRWHHRFAQRVVPPAMRYITAVGVFSIALGAFLLAALVVRARA